jgi:hypothetical protein
VSSFSGLFEKYSVAPALFGDKLMSNTEERIAARTHDGLATQFFYTAR